MAEKQPLPHGRGSEGLVGTSSLPSRAATVRERFYIRRPRFATETSYKTFWKHSDFILLRFRYRARTLTQLRLAADSKTASVTSSVNRPSLNVGGRDLPPPAAVRKSAA